MKLATLESDSYPVCTWVFIRLRRLHHDCVSTSPFLLSRPARLHCVNVSAFNAWMCLFSISNSGHWGVWKIFSSKSRKILIVDCPELRDSATYKLNKFNHPRNGQLKFILKKLLHYGWCCNVYYHCRQCLSLRLIVGKGIYHSHGELTLLHYTCDYIAFRTLTANAIWLSGRFHGYDAFFKSR